MIIRRAKLEDEIGITRLTLSMLESCGDSTSMLWDATKQNAEVFWLTTIAPAINSGDPIIVCEDNGNLVGLLVWVSVVSELFTFRHKYMFGYFTYVDIQHRGLGYSVAMRNKAIEIAKQVGIDRVIGSLDDGNGAGIGSAKRLGFRKIAETVITSLE